MSALVLIFVLLLMALLIILVAWTLWFQSYLYNEPVTGWWWRAPLAAILLTLFIALWGCIDYQSPGRYATLFLFSPSDEKDFPELTVVTHKDGQENATLYRLRKSAQGFTEYHAIVPPYRPLPSHPDAIIVREDEQDVRFEPERDQNGKFNVRQGQSLLYVDDRGRVMSEASLGHLSSFRWNLFLANVFLNFCHFMVWFLCLWLLLRFQWAQALGLAIVFWLAMTLIIVPMLLSKVEEAAHKPPPAAVSGLANVGKGWL